MPCTHAVTIQLPKRLTCCEEQTCHRGRTWNLKGYCQWISSLKDIQIKPPISSRKHAQCCDVSIKAASVWKDRPPLICRALAASQRDDGLMTVLRAEREAISNQTQTLLQSALHGEAVEGRGKNPRSLHTPSRRHFSFLVPTGPAAHPRPPFLHTQWHICALKTPCVIALEDHLSLCLKVFHHPENHSAPLSPPGGKPGRPELMRKHPAHPMQMEKASSVMGPQRQGTVPTHTERGIVTAGSLRKSVRMSLDVQALSGE